MWVERMALTFTSPRDHTICGSSFGSKVIVLINSAGPPAVRSLISEWRCATSPQEDLGALTVDLYGASTGRTRKIGSRLRATNPPRRDVLFLLSRPEAREGPTAHPRFRTIQVWPKDLQHSATMLSVQ